MDDLNPPFSDAQGHWVRRAEYKKPHGSFGYFFCTQCNKRWMSAYAQKELRQGCKDCNVYVKPRFLWLNHNKNDKSTKNNDKPHLQHLCEACKAGICDFNKT